MKTTTDTRPLVERITQELEPRESTNDTPAHLDRGIKYSPAWVECAWDGNAEAEANVELIYDAFETAHRTRRTPSELASERQELLDMLREVNDGFWLHPKDEAPGKANACRSKMVALLDRLIKAPANIS